MESTTLIETNERLSGLQKMIGEPAPKGISPVFNWLSPTLKMAEAGRVQFSYTISKHWLNPMNTLHGGLMATIIDDAMGVAVYSLGLPEFCTTLNLSVDYFVPVNAGDELQASAEVVKAGRQIIHVICEVRNAGTGKIVARATSNLMKTNLQK